MFCVCKYSFLDNDYFNYGQSLPTSNYGGLNNEHYEPNIEEHWRNNGFDVEKMRMAHLIPVEDKWSSK
jgi:hypothetical protein